MTHYQKKGGKWLKEALEVCETAVLNGETVNDTQALFDYLDTHFSQLIKE